MVSDGSLLEMISGILEYCDPHGLFPFYRGKTVVHWQATKVSTEESLLQLCCLNDRFALDGLSPPSYGGVLWCYGWQDKPAPGNRVSE